MKRRDMIKLGAVAAGAGVGLPGCTVPKLMSSLHGKDGAAAFNAMLDEHLGRLEGPGLLHRMVEGRTKKQLTPQQSAQIAEKDAMFRKLLSTVLITQAFRELPEDTQVEPAVQARMFSHYDQIGSTIYEVSDMLAALDPKQRASVRTTLTDKPDLPMELGEQLDSLASRTGLSTTRRLQLRKMMAQTAFRLKNGHASSLIDEYTAKVDKLRTTDERNAAAIDLATKLGERAFWRRQQQMKQAPGASQPVPPPTHPGPQPPQPQPGGPVAPPPGQPPLQAQEPMHIMLHKSARSAAKRGDCKAIEVLGKRVYELDAEYHRTAFATDPLLINCRPGVAVDNVGRPLPPPAPVAAQPVIKPPDKPGTKGLRVGGYMFGIGLAVGAGSALLVAVEADIAILGLFGLTAAVILVGLGLIILLISAIIYASND
jgi:hypothetical protein